MAKKPLTAEPTKRERRSSGPEQEQMAELIRTYGQEAAGTLELMADRDENERERLLDVLEGLMQEKPRRHVFVSHLDCSSTEPPPS